MTYEFDDDPARVDREAAWRFMTASAYWARWRTRSDFYGQVDSAWRVVGCYLDDAMIGFCRAVSDGIGLAYLADVYVDPAHRGRGLGQRLVHAMIEDGAGRDFRWMLNTDDAHGLYARFGFAAPADAMERAHGFASSRSRG